MGLKNDKKGILKEGQSKKILKKGKRQEKMGQKKPQINDKKSKTRPQKI